MSKTKSGRWVSAVPAELARHLMEAYHHMGDTRRFMDALDVFEISKGGCVGIHETQAKRIIETIGPIVKFDKNWTFEKWMDGKKNAV